MELGLLLHTKITELTLLGAGPWLLCWDYGSTLMERLQMNEA